VKYNLIIFVTLYIYDPRNIHMFSVLCSKETVLKVTDMYIFPVWYKMSVYIHILLAASVA